MSCRFEDSLEILWGVRSTFWTEDTIFDEYPVPADTKTRGFPVKPEPATNLPVRLWPVGFPGFGHPEYTSTKGSICTKYVPSLVLFFSRLVYRTNGLLSRIKCRNGGIWCGPRVVPMLWKGIFRKKAQNTALDTNYSPSPKTLMNIVWKKSGFFFLPKKLVDHAESHTTKYSPISTPYPR